MIFQVIPSPVRKWWWNALFPSWSKFFFFFFLFVVFVVIVFSPTSPSSSSSSSSSATPPPLPIILKTYLILSYNLIIITLVHGWLTTRNLFRSSTELCMLSLAYLRFLGSMSHSAKYVQVSFSSSRSSTALKSFSKKLIYISHSLPRRSNCIPIRIHYMKMNALFSLSIIVAGSNAWIIITKALWKHTRTLYVIVSQHDMLFNGVLSILLSVNSPRRLILLL